MFEFSPTHTSVHDMERQELLAKVARYRLVDADRANPVATQPEIAAPRFKLVRSCARYALNALSPVAFGFGNS